MQEKMIKEEKISDLNFELQNIKAQYETEYLQSLNMNQNQQLELQQVKQERDKLNNKISVIVNQYKDAVQEQVKLKEYVSFLESQNKTHEYIELQKQNQSRQVTNVF